MQTAVQNQFTFIELDLCVSKDKGAIIAAHGIGNLNNRVNHPTLSPDIKFDVENDIIFFEKYSLLNAADINTLSSAHNKLWLVTDKYKTLMPCLLK